jgi:hypothetical protein
MAIREKHYSSQLTPNTVSADRAPQERGFVGVVFQSGKPPVDYEIQLLQDVRSHLEKLLVNRGLSSGFLKGQNRQDAYTNYSFDGPGGTPNTFHLAKHTALIAGVPLVVEYTDSSTPGDNIIQLDAPPVLGGAPPDVKRTDFVFLEAWFSLVAPSPRATGTITVDPVLPSALDTVTINGNVLTAVAGAPGVDEFQIGGDEFTTAANMVTAINDGANSYSGDVAAKVQGGNVVFLTAQTPGPAGNAITLASSVPLVLILSGATLTGGATRPNKPSDTTLYRHGNVLADPAVNLPDDLEDPVILFETAQRVQFQYRIRVTGQSEAVNFKTQPDGFSNPNILAQGAQGAPVANYPFVPADKTTVSFNSSAVAYGVEDPGLWIAGDGSSSSATDLQTLDGLVYAIPIGMVFRRNDDSAGAGFDPKNNANGGLPSTHGGHVNPFVGIIAAGTSDRPDDALVDIINENDILDLRRHVCYSGWDCFSELEWQMKSLMDGNYRTWAIDAADKQSLGTGSGDVSTRFLVCNEIGRGSSVGGNNSTSGNTGRGVTVRNFDHVARRFGAHSVVERVVFSLFSQDRETGPATPPGVVNPGKYVVKDGAAPGNVGWFEGDEIHIDLDSINASTDGTFDPSTASLAALLSNISDFAPPGTAITDVLSVYHDDGDYSSVVDQRVQVGLVEGLGTPHVVLHLDGNPTSVTGGVIAASYQMVGDASAGDVGSPRRIFVELEISYPKGAGLTDTPDYTLTPEATNYDFGPMLENDVSQRPADMEDPLSPLFREGYRETALEYIASENGGGAPIGSITTEQFVSRDTTSVVFLRRVFGSSTLVVNATDAVTTTPVPIDISSTEYGSSSRVVNLGAPLSGAGHTLTTVTYFAQDPIPNYGAVGGGYQVSVYYRSNAPQTAGTKAGVITDLLPLTFEVEPLSMSKGLWTAHTGVGSVDLPFPYSVPMDQIPVNQGGGFFPGEWYFCASSQISIDDFNANTGMLNLHTLIPADETVPVSFGNVLNPPDKDIEFRSFYDFADDQAYRPTIMTQPLTGAVRHKVFAPFLARVTQNGGMFRKGEVVLVVLSRWAELDADNTVLFTDSGGQTCAGIYRTRNLLLVVGDE